MRTVSSFALLLLAMPAAAHAASPVRLVEAFAVPGWSSSATVKVVPATPLIAADPQYPLLAATLAEALKRAGMHVDPGASPDAYVALDYQTRTYLYAYGVNDNSYRTVVVTAVAPPQTGAETPHVLWRTAFEQSGVLIDPAAILPPMLKTAEPWYGRNLTLLKLSAADLTVAGVHR